MHAETPIAHGDPDAHAVGTRLDSHGRGFLRGLQRVRHEVQDRLADQMLVAADRERTVHVHRDVGRALERVAGGADGVLDERLKVDRVELERLRPREGEQIVDHSLQPVCLFFDNRQEGDSLGLDDGSLQHRERVEHDGDGRAHFVSHDGRELSERCEPLASTSSAWVARRRAVCSSSECALSTKREVSTMPTHDTSTRNPMSARYGAS